MRLRQGFNIAIAKAREALRRGKIGTEKGNNRYQRLAMEAEASDLRGETKKISDEAGGRSIARGEEKLKSQFLLGSRLYFFSEA